MAKTLRDWLRPVLVHGFGQLLDLKRKRLMAKDLIKPDPDLDVAESKALIAGDDAEDSQDDRMEDDGSNIRWDLSLDTTRVHRLQIVSIQPGPRRARAILSDGHDQVFATLTKDVADLVARKAQRPLEQTIGATFTARSFQLVVTHLGGNDFEQLAIHIDAITYHSGSAGAGLAGHPRSLRNNPDIVKLFERLTNYGNGIIDIEDRQSQNTHMPNVALPGQAASAAKGTAPVSGLPSPLVEKGNDVMEVEDDAGFASQGELAQEDRSDVAAHVDLTQSSAGEMFATQLPAHNTLKRKRSGTDVVILEGVNLALPQRSSTTSTKKRHLLQLGRLQGNTGQNGVGTAEVDVNVESETKPLLLPSADKAQKITAIRPKSSEGRSSQPNMPDGTLSPPKLTEERLEISQSRSDRPISPAVHDSADSAGVQPRSSKHAVMDKPINPDKQALLNVNPPDGSARQLNEVTTTPGTNAVLSMERPGNMAQKSSPGFGPSLAKQAPSISTPLKLRSPGALAIKYARRAIPEQQLNLLERKHSWLPSYVGETFPNPNVPLDILEALKARRAAKTSNVPSEDAAKPCVTGSKPDGGLVQREIDTAEKGIADSTQGTIASSWSPSPEREVAPVKLPAQSLPPPLNAKEGDLPADSSDDGSKPRYGNLYKSRQALSQGQKYHTGVSTEQQSSPPTSEISESESDGEDDNLDSAPKLPRYLPSNSDPVQLRAVQPQYMGTSMRGEDSAGPFQHQSVKAEIEVEQSPSKISQKTRFRSSGEAIPATQQTPSRVCDQSDRASIRQQDNPSDAILIDSSHPLTGSSSSASAPPLQKIESSPLKVQTTASLPEHPRASRGARDHASLASSSSSMRPPSQPTNPAPSRSQPLGQLPSPQLLDSSRRLSYSESRSPVSQDISQQNVSQSRSDKPAVPAFTSPKHSSTENDRPAVSSQPGPDPASYRAGQSAGKRPFVDDPRPQHHDQDDRDRSPRPPRSPPGRKVRSRLKWGSEEFLDEDPAKTHQRYRREELRRRREANASHVSRTTEKADSEEVDSAPAKTKPPYPNDDKAPWRVNTTWKDTLKWYLRQKTLPEKAVPSTRQEENHPKSNNGGMAQFFDRYNNINLVQLERDQVRDVSKLDIFNWTLHPR